MSKFSEISPSQLMRRIGLPDAPQILDVCTPEDFAEDPFLVPSSVKTSAADVLETLSGDIDRPIVVVCQKGKKLSHGTAALLRANGRQAEVLTGGMYGWRDAGLPRVPAAALPQPQNGSTLWVTRHRPKIDRIACPWLIRRFVDPKAQFLFVPPADVMAVAEKFNATAFDVENAPFTHGGDTCTFDAVIDTFGLSHSALDSLATVVRAADLGQHHLAPEAAGLLAISVGLSRQFTNDTEQLDAGLKVYDALYRWARDGQSETHNSGFGPRA